MSSTRSVHDNLLLSYTVEHEPRRITFRTVYQDIEPNEYTDVLFSGVIAYHFEGDTFGTILFDITETELSRLYADYEELFRRQKNYGWPLLGYGSPDELIDRFQREGVKAFTIHSSCGMEGFVHATEMKFCQPLLM
jgi:hypothetical protein